MWPLFFRLNQNLHLAIPAMLLAGFVYGLCGATAGLKQAILPLTFLMVYPMMVNLNLRQVLQRGDAKAQWLAQAINFGIIPSPALAVCPVTSPSAES